MSEQPTELSTSRGHESADLPLNPFLFVVLGLLGTAIVVQVALFSLMFAFARMGSRFGPIDPSKAAQVQHLPQPEIQVDPGRDLRTYLAREEKELNGYGWVDRGKGIVHVPIRKAMELMLARGVPVRQSEQGSTELELQQQRSRLRAAPATQTTGTPKENP